MDLERTILENVNLKESLEKSKHTATGMDQEKKKLDEQIKTVIIFEMHFNTIHFNVLSLFVAER